jgi:hypothetical protein
MTAKEVADDIANQLNYPPIDTDTNEPVLFYLVDGKGKRIDDNTQLGAAGLRNGDTIKIQATKKIIPPDGPLPQVPPQDGKLGLTIKIIGKPKPVAEQFDPDTTVHALLTEMITKYSLPTHYPDGVDQIPYVVSSNTLGRQLHSSETLREARVPNSDTLSIFTHNIAGGRDEE